MKRTAWGLGLVAVVAMGTMPASASMPSIRTETEDDLAVVRRGVAASSPVEPTGRPGTQEPDRTGPDARKKGERPQWLRVRVVDKGTRKAKVSINLPLGLVRALGDDMPLDLDCGRRDREDESRGRRACTIKVSDILKSLESGQELVEVDDDEATVRVWVE